MDCLPALCTMPAGHFLCRLLFKHFSGSSFLCGYEDSSQPGLLVTKGNKKTATVWLAWAMCCRKNAAFPLWLIGWVIRKKNLQLLQQTDSRRTLERCLSRARSGRKKKKMPKNKEKEEKEFEQGLGHHWRAFWFCVVWSECSFYEKWESPYHWPKMQITGDGGGCHDLTERRMEQEEKEDEC